MVQSCAPLFVYVSSTSCQHVPSKVTPLSFAQVHFVHADESEHAARAQLQGGGLLQADMAAFKAANPTCQLADFVRWHSPKDWHPDPTQPQGGSLSDRMSHEVRYQFE